MIREALREELSKTRRLKEAVAANKVYITYLNYDGEYGLWNITKNKAAAKKYFNNTAINELEKAPFDPEYGKLYLIEAEMTDAEYNELEQKNKDRDLSYVERTLRKLKAASSTVVLDSYNA